MFSAERSGRKPILALWRRLREGSPKVRIIGSMLVELTVESYAVVDRLRVRFHTGLNLLTGETGSGKSIVVDALGLLFGDGRRPRWSARVKNGRASPAFLKSATAPRCAGSSSRPASR